MPRRRPSKPGTDAAAGTQSIDRAVALLRLISSHGARGARLSELAGEAELAPPTARRILKRLTEHRLVAQDRETQRYALGALTYELGLASGFKPPIIAQLKPLMERIAEQLGDTVYLVVRSGLDAVCVERLEGSFPIKTLTLEVGGRRPLGVGAAGLALLAAQDDDDIEHILDANRDLYRKISTLSADQVRADIAKSRKQGYAIRHDGITPGVAGIGMAIPNPGAVPYAAMSVAMISARLTDDRLEQFVTLMRGLAPRAVAGRR